MRVIQAHCVVCGQNAFEPVLAGSAKLADLFLARLEAFSAAQLPLKRVEFPLVRCLNCGFVFVPGARQEEQDAQRLTGPPTAEEWARVHYNDPALDLPKKQREEMEAYRPLLEKIESLAPKGRLLDIGAGLGWWLAAARERGWQVTGTDLNTRLIEYTRNELGLEILQGHLCDLGLPQHCYDVVTLFDVLEHLFDVEETLTELRRILKRDGLLLIRVPNIGSLRARIHLESWEHLSPWHVGYFSDATLSALLARFGFEVEGIESGMPDSFAHLAEADPHFARFLFQPATQGLFREGCYGDLLTCFARNEPTQKRAWRLAGYDTALADQRARNEALAAENAQIRAQAEEMSQQLGRIYSRWPMRALVWLKRLSARKA